MVGWVVGWMVGWIVGLLVVVVVGLVLCWGKVLGFDVVLVLLMVGVGVNVKCGLCGVCLLFGVVKCV